MTVKLEVVGMDAATECYGAAIKFAYGAYTLSCLVQKEVKDGPCQKWESLYDDAYDVRIEDGIYFTYRENGERVFAPHGESTKWTPEELRKRTEVFSIADFVKCNTREEWLAFRLKHGEENYRVSAI